MKLDRWGWYESTMVQKPNGKWASTVPKICPCCAYDWSNDGLDLLPGTVYVGWGVPPHSHRSTTFLACEYCGFRAYESGDVDYRPGCTCPRCMAPPR